MSGQFRDLWYLSAPQWLRTDDAEKYMYTLETMRDLLMEKAYQASAIRIPGKGDPSQIPYLAFDRQLLQGPNESDASFIRRLVVAFETWKKAGSSYAVLEQLQAYTQGMQTYAPPTAVSASTDYSFAIVSDPRFQTGVGEAGGDLTTWYTQRVSDPVGEKPVLSTVPANFYWDNAVPFDALDPRSTWRNWLILYQYAQPVLSGTGASTLTAGGGSFAEPGWNVGGVWVPRTVGTPINAPFLTVAGLAGLTQDNLGNVLTLTGSVNPGNWGTFQIVQVVNSTTCVIANKSGVSADAGPLTWVVKRYQWIPPGLARGSPGQVRGAGETSPPPIDTGSNVRGTWQPTVRAGAGTSPSYSRGLRISSLVIDTIRGLVKTWKSAGTYYPNLIVCYDVNPAGVENGPGAYNRLFAAGVGNPDGDFGSVGKLVDGVWVPARELSSQFDAYCQGTGRAVACAVENIT